jgi:hypothetical protein
MDTYLILDTWLLVLYNGSQSSSYILFFLLFTVGTTSELIILIYQAWGCLIVANGIQIDTLTYLPNLIQDSSEPACS